MFVCIDSFDHTGAVELSPLRRELQLHVSELSLAPEKLGEGQRDGVASWLHSGYAQLGCETGTSEFSRLPSLKHGPGMGHTHG